MESYNIPLLLITDQYQTDEISHTTRLPLIISFNNRPNYKYYRSEAITSLT